MVHRKHIKINKKGITLETAVALILMVLSLGIIIILLFSSGLISSLQSSICTFLTMGSSWVRGFVISSLWTIYWVILGLVASIMFLFGTTCRSAPPFSYAICAGIYAVFFAYLTVAFTTLAGGLPLLTCPNPTIILGTANCSAPEGVSNITFMREVADRSIDCWVMYASGQFDPLAGREPPNPVTCFVVDFKLKQPISAKNIAEWMSSTSYSRGTSYWERAGGMIVLQNNSKELWNQTFLSGRLFIKYGDAETLAKWGSADCQIRNYGPPSRTDYVIDYPNEGSTANILGWSNDSSIVNGLTQGSSAAVFNWNGQLYLISGSTDGHFYGYKWSTSSNKWEQDSSITTGLPSGGYYYVPVVFEKDNMWYLIFTNETGNSSDTDLDCGIIWAAHDGCSEWYGYKWSGSQWILDSLITNGLTKIDPSYVHPTIFKYNGNLYLISGSFAWPKIAGWIWNNTNGKWENSSYFINGFPSRGPRTGNSDSNGYTSRFSTPVVFYDKSGGLNILIGGVLDEALTLSDALFHSAKWEGTTWKTVDDFSNGIFQDSIPALSSTRQADWHPKPTVFNKAVSSYLIVGSENGKYAGYVLNETYSKEAAYKSEKDDHLYWCFEADKTCNSTCQAFIPGGKCG